MNPIILRYAGLALIAAIFGGGGGYLAVNNGKQSPPQIVQSGTIPAQPFPGQGIPAIPAIPGTQSTTENKITVLTPNGGEVFFTGRSTNLISWKGNTKRGLKIALLREDATPNVDPTPFIVGWIFAGTIGENLYPWNDKVIYNEIFTETNILPPGNYKILVASDDGNGKFVLWNKSTSKPGNFDISDRPFTVVPTPRLRVISPNGGEVFKIGQTVPISFEASNMGYYNGLPIAITVKRTPDAYYTIGTTLQLVYVGSDTNTYTYNWTIRADEFVPGTDYYILVDDTGFWNEPRLPDPDRSDTPFSIIAP